MSAVVIQLAGLALSLYWMKQGEHALWFAFGAGCNLTGSIHSLIDWHHARRCSVGPAPEAPHD